MSALYCVYCGMQCEFHCWKCRENHLVTAEEFKDYNGDWPDDGEDHDEEQQ